MPDLEYRFADFWCRRGHAGSTGLGHPRRLLTQLWNQFADVILAEPPYVDPAGLAETKRDWKQYIGHIRAYGYNGVIVNGFLEYVNFDGVGDGFEVYGQDSPIGPGTRRWSNSSAPWKYAADMGYGSCSRRTCFANTGPLNDHIETRTRRFDVNDPRLWEVYQAGLGGFFTNMPYVDGLMIRSGRSTIKPAGTTSRRWRSPPSIRAHHAHQVHTDCRRLRDKTIYFRTWSVGVGDIGDMHTNPQTYEKILVDCPMTTWWSSPNSPWGLLLVAAAQPDPRAGRSAPHRGIPVPPRVRGLQFVPQPPSGDHQIALQDFEQANPNIVGSGSGRRTAGPWRPDRCPCT